MQPNFELTFDKNNSLISGVRQVKLFWATFRATFRAIITFLQKGNTTVPNFPVYSKVKALDFPTLTSVAKFLHNYST